MTRTYTSYFTEDDLGNLPATIDRLAFDFEERAPYIDPDIARAGRERIDAVRLAVARLIDRVPE